MPTPFHMLVLEDSPTDAVLMIHELQRSGFAPTWERVETKSEYLAALRPDLDLILADFALPQFDALEALVLLKERELDIPFIVVTGSLEEIALECLKQGADDYLLKDRLARLGPAITQALERRRAQSERRQAEAAQLELADLNHAVLRSIEAHIAVLSPRGQIVAVNEAWEAFARTNGAGAETTGVGVNYLEICRRAADAGDACAAEALAAIEAILTGERTTFTMECPCHAPHEERWFIMQARPLLGRGGAILVYENVTEQRQLELQFQHAQRFESLGRLASGVAHDFNNLLGAISGNCELLAELLPQTPASQRRLDAIIRATQSAAALTRQLLAFARRQPIEPRPISLNEVVRDTLVILEPLAGSKVRLLTELTPELPLVLADPEQIEQVLVNLVVNACDAMPGGGTITLCTTRDKVEPIKPVQDRPIADGSVSLEVRDTGAGMAPEVLARAFEPFFTTKEPGKGTGLGLATCYGIVRQHGGEIVLASEVGHGTQVRVTLPALLSSTVKNLLY